MLCNFSLQLIFFSEQPFYGNYSTLDSHTNTVISHAFAYSSRWRQKPWQGLFRRLQSFILSTLQVSELADCVFHCLFNESCFWLNFGREAAGNDKTHPCELLSGDIFREADNLVAQSDFHHYSIKVHVACFVFLSSTLRTLKSAHI